MLLLISAEGPHMDWLKLGFALTNFAILLVILKKILGPALGGMARVRSEQIKNDLDEAARLRLEAETRLGEYQKRLAGIEEEVAEMVAAIRKDADAEKERILAAARAQAAAIAADAERALAAEISRVEREIRQEAARAAINAAEKILRERVTADDERHIVERFARELETTERDTRA